MNRPNCEIIRGEVSIFRGEAGGLSYFSSGSFRGTLRVGANWPGAVASPDSKTKQIKKRVFDIIKHLKLKKSDRISEHTRGVHQIFFNANPLKGESDWAKASRRQSLLRNDEAIASQKSDFRGKGKEGSELVAAFSVGTRQACRTAIAFQPVFAVPPQDSA